MKFISLNIDVIHQASELKKCALCALENPDCSLNAWWELTDKNNEGGYYGLLNNSVIQGICSLCLLYKTDWGTDLKEDIVSLLKTTNASKMTYELNGEDQIINPASADNFIAAIYLSNKVKNLFSKNIKKTTI